MTKDQEAKLLAAITLGFRAVVVSNVAVIASTLIEAGEEEESAIEKAVSLYQQVDGAASEILH